MNVLSNRKKGKGKKKVPLIKKGKTKFLISSSLYELGLLKRKKKKKAKKPTAR